MGREIKFRYWNKEKSKYVKQEFMQYQPEQKMSFGKHILIEQYTGLKDFYEGDLIKISGGDLSESEIEQIKYEDFMFMVGDYSLYFANDNYILEKVGNIHKGEIIVKNS